MPIVATVGGQGRRRHELAASGSKWNTEAAARPRQPPGDVTGKQDDGVGQVQVGGTSTSAQAAGKVPDENAECRAERSRREEDTDWDR